MKAGWSFALAFLVLAGGLPLVASAGHGRHGGYASGGCCCGSQVYYAPPATAQYGQPTPAVAQRSDYQSFSYSPTPAAEVNVAPEAAPVMMYAPAYNYSGYRSWNSYRRVPAYNNAINKSLGYNDYGIGRR
jgi:hypothetical protein